MIIKKNNISYKAAFCCLLLLFCYPSLAGEMSIEGRIFDSKTNKSISGALVTMIINTRGDDLEYVSTISDESGQYEIKYTRQGRYKNIDIVVKKLGWEMLEKFGKSKSFKKNKGNLADLNIPLTAVVNIADQVPASAWLAQIPESPEKHETQVHCIGCHQLPAEKVKTFSENIEVATNANKGKIHDKWKTQARKEAWRSAVKYMRAKSYDIFPEGTEVDLAKIPWESVQAPEYSLFDEKDEVVVAELLGEYMPRDYSYMAAGGYDYGAPIYTETSVKIFEHQLPDTSLVREAVSIQGGEVIVGADIQKNRLVEFDTRSHEQKWHPVPYKGSTGPHTIVPDGNDNVWVSMLESNQLGRFNPKSNTWKLYNLLNSESEIKLFGGEGMVHDIGFGPGYKLKKGADNKIWMTLIGSNKLAALNTETEEVEYIDVPKPNKDRSDLSTALYSLAVSGDGKCVWWGQLLGYVGCYDVSEKKFKHIYTPNNGSGPRRMSIDKNDVLWIPYYGSGQVAKINAKTGEKIATYNLPDRSSAPYAVTWDEFRKVLWVATANADVIYRFDPNAEKFSVIPLPRKMAYLRKIDVDEKTHDLVGSYGNIPTGSGPSMLLRISID